MRNNNKISFFNYLCVRIDPGERGLLLTIFFITAFPGFLIFLMFLVSFIFQSLSYLFELFMEVI